MEYRLRSWDNITQTEKGTLLCSCNRRVKEKGVAMLLTPLMKSGHYRGSSIPRPSKNRPIASMRYMTRCGGQTSSCLLTALSVPTKEVGIDGVNFET